MPGPRFCAHDDEPVVNKFDLPVSWEDPEPTAPEVVSCCSECAAWNQCLSRIPLRMDLQGFAVGDWLDSLLNDAGDSGLGGADLVGDDADSAAGVALRGTFLAVPWFRLWGGFPDPGNPVYPARLNALCGVAPYEQPTCMCGTHYGIHGRTIATPNATFSRSELWLDAAATCEEGTGANAGQPVIVFRVYLFTVQDLCGEPTHLCCELLRSDEIPTAGLELADLVDVPLYPRTYEDYLDDLATWEAATSDPSYPPDCPGPCTDLGESDTDDPASAWCERSQHAVPEDGCPPYFCGVARRFCEYEHLEDCTGEDEHYWSFVDPWCREGTRPIVPEGEAGGGSYGNAISLALGRCDFNPDCLACAGEPPGLKTVVEVDFDVTGSGCVKTFTAVVPECLEVAEYYWSFGKTGASVSHAIVNENEAGEKTEDVTLVVIDTRGCAYIARQTVTCECPCPGVSAGLGISISATEDPCTFDFELSAAIFGPEECRDGAFMEVCLVDGTAYDCDDCDEPCVGCLYLGDGDSTVVQRDFVADGPLCFAWRLWDGPCGCASPWTYTTSYHAAGAPCFVPPGDCP